MSKKNGRMSPVHPGEILRDDLMKPPGLTVSRLARELKIPVNRMSEIVSGRRAVNADAALRLSRYFSNTPEFWINLQAAYDLSMTIHSSATRIEREVRPRNAASVLSVSCYVSHPKAFEVKYLQLARVSMRISLV